MTRYLSAGVMAPGPPVTCRSRDLGVAFGVTAPRPPVTCRGRDLWVAFRVTALEPPMTHHGCDLEVAFGVTALRPPVTCRDRGVAFGAAAAGHARVPIPAQSTPSFLSLSITLPLGV